MMEVVPFVCFVETIVVSFEAAASARRLRSDEKCGTDET